MGIHIEIVTHRVLYRMVLNGLIYTFHITHAYPALCYIDDRESYSTNEVDTYWNTLAVMLISYIIKKK